MLRHPSQPSDALPEFSEEQLRKALRKLTPRQRQVLDLRIGERLTCAQIAERQHLPYAAVLRDLSKAYSRLYMQLARPTR